MLERKTKDAASADKKSSDPFRASGSWWKETSSNRQERRGSRLDTPFRPSLPIGPDREESACRLGFKQPCRPPFSREHAFESQPPSRIQLLSERFLGVGPRACLERRSRVLRSVGIEYPASHFPFPEGLPAVGPAWVSIATARITPRRCGSMERQRSMGTEHPAMGPGTV
jgi:hypothetical protein